MYASDRVFTVNKFWMDGPSGVALALKMGVLTLSRQIAVQWQTLGRMHLNRLAFVLALYLFQFQGSRHHLTMSF